MRNPRVAVCGIWGLLPVFSSLPLRMFACLLLAVMACAMPGATTVAAGPHAFAAPSGASADTCIAPRDCAGPVVAVSRDAPPPAPDRDGDDAAPGKRRTQARLAPVGEPASEVPASPMPFFGPMIDLASLQLDTVPPCARFARPSPDATLAGRPHLRASRGRAPPLA